MPMVMELIITESLIDPFTTIPSHSFLIASNALLSPSIAHLKDSPASITKTLPLPFIFKASSTRELSSKHLIVTMRPEKAVLPP